MANYIKSDLICQAYLRVDLPTPDEETLERLRKALHAYVDERGNFFLNEQVEANVTLKEGSIIEYLTIFGSVCALIHQYPSFREAVQLIYSDVKRLTESMTLEAQFITGAKNASVVHSEARTGLIGLLKVTIDRIQNTKDSYGLVRISTLTRRLKASMNDSIRIIEALTNNSDKRYIATNLRDILYELSDSPPQKRKLDRPEPNALAEFRITLKNYINILEDFENMPDNEEAEQDAP